MCNSCIIVCTVYGICTVRGLHIYSRGQSPRKYMKARGRYNPRHCIKYDTADLYPHLLGSSFWRWNVINCPGGCTIDNHILSLPDVIACNLIFTLTRIVFCKHHAILCAVQAQKGFSLQNMGNEPTWWCL